MALLAPGPRSVNPYLAAADLIRTLPAQTKLARADLGITTKVQATQIGIGYTTLQRFENGSDPNQSTVLAVLAWLAKSGG